MRILQVYNRRRAWGGEDHCFDNTVRLLRQAGHQVEAWVKTLDELPRGLAGKVTAFATGLYSVGARAEMTRRIDAFRPEVVHVHNIYPQFSASIFAACRDLSVPVVWHRHDHRPICPTGLHLRDGRICERCLGGREYHCLLSNCRGRLAESFAYALRTMAGRAMGWFKRDVTLLLVPSSFLKERFVQAGFRPDRICVVSQPVDIPPESVLSAPRSCVVYAGRLGPEKGVETLVEAARRLPHVTFRIAGEGPVRSRLETTAPANVTFLGWQERDSLARLYCRARAVVVPSVCFETFGFTAAEAMAHGAAVVASRRGALAELVDDAVTGLLFEPGNVDDLTGKIDRLWQDEALCRRLARAGRRQVARENTEGRFMETLMEAYRKARQHVDAFGRHACKNRPASPGTGRNTDDE